MAASTPIVLFSEMLKFQRKGTIFFVKENKEF
jgi:hypothetical protein